MAIVKVPSPFSPLPEVGVGGDGFIHLFCSFNPERPDRRVELVADARYTDQGGVFEKLVKEHGS